MHQNPPICYYQQVKSNTNNPMDFWEMKTFNLTSLHTDYSYAYWRSDLYIQLDNRLSARFYKYVGIEWLHLIEHSCIKTGARGEQKARGLNVNVLKEVWARSREHSKVKGGYGRLSSRG